MDEIICHSAVHAQLQFERENPVSSDSHEHHELKALVLMNKPFQSFARLLIGNSLKRALALSNPEAFQRENEPFAGVNKFSYLFPKNMSIVNCIDTTQFIKLKGFVSIILNNKIHGRNLQRRKFVEAFCFLLIIFPLSLNVTMSQKSIRGDYEILGQNCTQSSFSVCYF